MPPFTISLSTKPYLPAKGTKMVGEFHDYFVKKGFNRISVKSMCTENINSCTAGVISNGDRNFMFHAAPEFYNGSLGRVKEEITREVRKLGNPEEQEINGFVCGGWELNNNDKEAVQSFNLYTTIVDTLEDLGVKFSMLCGKKRSEGLDNIYAVNQHINIWNDSLREIVKDKTIDPKKIIEKLEEKYQFVEQDKNHIFTLG